MKHSLYQHLPKLATLDLIVEVASFRAAAARAHVTQSALSQTVSTLEEVFGQPLLIREGGSVRPTAVCIQLLERMRPVFKTMNELAGGLGHGEDLPPLASLDLGSYESLAINVLPGLSRRLRAAFPALQRKLQPAPALS
jgi:DNA-binding transcriptional LysR family regulator